MPDGTHVNLPRPGLTLRSDVLPAPGLGVVTQAAEERRGAWLLAALQRVGIRGLLQVGDQIGPVRRIGYAGVSHRGARHHLLGILQKLVERLLVPDDLRLLHGRRIVKTRHAAGQPAEQAAMVWPDPVVCQRVARHATYIDLLAVLHIRRRLRAGSAECDGAGQHQAARLHDMKAVGTGGMPSAWRSTAQCMASSPRMLAAALARSRLRKRGTAPR